MTAVRAHRTKCCKRHKDHIRKYLGGSRDSCPLDKEGIPKPDLAEDQLEGLGVGEEWHRFVYKHRDNDAQRKLQGSIVKILTGSWNVETIEELTAAQAAFTLTTVEHALRHGVDTKLPTDGDDCAERCDTYSGYLTEVGKWAHLPGGAVTLVGGVPLPAGVQAKPPGKRKAQEGHSEEADAELDDDEQSHGLRGGIVGEAAAKGAPRRRRRAE